MIVFQKMRDTYKNNDLNKSKKKDPQWTYYMYGLDEETGR